MTIRIRSGEDSYLARERSCTCSRRGGHRRRRTCSDYESLHTPSATFVPTSCCGHSMPPTHTDEASARRRAPDAAGVASSSSASTPSRCSRRRSWRQLDRRAYLLKSGAGGRRVPCATSPRTLDRRPADRRVAATARRRRETPGSTRSHRGAGDPRPVAEGLSNAAIAERIVITKRAVERHINSIFSKLGLADAQHFSRRVKAALLYLAGQAATRSGAAPARGRSHSRPRRPRCPAQSAACR